MGDNESTSPETIPDRTQPAKGDSQFLDLLKQIISINESELFKAYTAIGSTDTALEKIDQSIRNIALHGEIIGNTRIKAELESLKREILPQLQESRDSLRTVEEFLKNHATFLINSIAAQGKIQSIEGELSSILHRVEKIEDDRNTSWNRGIAIGSLIVAIVSVGVALYVALAR